MSNLERQICRRIVSILNDTFTKYHYSYTIGTIRKNPILHASNSRGSKSVQLDVTVHNYKLWIKDPKLALTPITKELTTGPEYKEMVAIQQDFLEKGW